MDRFALEVLSGTRRGPVAALLRAGLSLAEPLYSLGVRVRNAGYDRGWKSIERAPIPVISVGNVTTGGTGKTPTVAWLVQWLKEQGARPGILSRGYRSLDGEENDEKRLLDALCPGVPHLQNPDRVTSARRAVTDEDCTSLVLDDGFQHRRLGRDLDIVLIDCLNPWGYGHLLPRGLLREPRSSLNRAGVILLTRAGHCDATRREQIREEIARHTAAPALATTFEPTGFVNAVGDRLPADGLMDRRVAAFCGIGNPAGFRRTLTGMGLPVGEERLRVFPDHYHYNGRDLALLGQWGEELQADLLVTTRKDLVKLSDARIGRCPVWSVDIELRFLDDPAPLEQALLQTLGRKCPA
ncbi:Tetraacyldisaccharide 4'-kinase [Maioricimonas rarisocia]|uniref:Tetraacyldisaccharide 4'-kinase n=1 Tax=Maioricimonas rarisocia TaxID=2528026 RepID=A0A517ZGA3_9PLAN|nr:tetraacyldisaccharide 4'-kinase [Maioricimonas rarisocia]QDU41505.1 Tetraacyldisaccharide 4'-kinase [Maioricimonas rarisocia]